jgi:membrane fusion protein, multidrug efflux system
MRKKILLIILLVSAIVILSIVFIRIVIKIVKANNKPSKITYNVNEIKIEKTLLKETISAQSIVEGDPQVKVYPNNVTGIFIKNSVSEGDFVIKDQDLAFIDRDIPGSDYLPAPVKSPISGIVTKLYFQDRGAIVTLQQPIAEVANISKVKITINLGEKDLLKVKKDQPVLVTSDYTDTVHINAIVNSVTPYIDSDSFSGYITIHIDNRDKTLVIGMSVNVDIEIAERMAYVVPESTVLMGENITYVFLNKNNKAKMLNVTTGFIKNGFTEINGDIQDGDEIITDGNFKLFDGASVKVAK